MNQVSGIWNGRQGQTVQSSSMFDGLNTVNNVVLYISDAVTQHSSVNPIINMGMSVKEASFWNVKCSIQ